MKERELIAKAKAELDNMGLWYWVAHKSPYYPQPDLFGLFDICYLYLNDTADDVLTGYIQVTTKSHLSHRRNKIVRAFEAKRLSIPSCVQVWAYDSEAARFIKETIT